MALKHIICGTQRGMEEVRIGWRCSAPNCLWWTSEEVFGLALNKFTIHIRTDHPTGHFELKELTEMQPARERY